MSFRFENINLSEFSVSLGVHHKESNRGFLETGNVIISASDYYIGQGRFSSFSRAWIDGGDDEVELGQEGLMILVDPDSGSNDRLNWTSQYNTYFVTGTNHILLERYGSGSAPFPYILIYNGLESGGIDIGPLGATSNRELQNKYAQLLRTNYANPNLPVLQEIYKVRTIEWDSINSVLGVSKASVSHITLDGIRELSYVLKESGTGFNLEFSRCKMVTSTAFGLPDSDWNKATYTWYRDGSIIASEEHRVIDTSVYGAEINLDIDFLLCKNK